MFYDFNNYSGLGKDQPSHIDDYTQSQGGDRLPSRNYRSRGRMGMSKE